jgi:hypothetical protein
LLRRWGVVEAQGPRRQAGRQGQAKAKAKAKAKSKADYRQWCVWNLSGSLLLVLADVAQERAAEDLAKQRRRARVLSRQSALLVLSGLAQQGLDGLV